MQQRRWIVGCLGCLGLITGPGLAMAQTEPDGSTTGNSTMMRLQSVSELTDVQPTDWAYQALQSLMQRYGALLGYPDNTFRGDRALSRYEFAAALNLFMRRLDQQVATSRQRVLLEQEDVLILQRLQTEYRGALQELGTRLDDLEGRTADLEMAQFSMTTKLQGETVLAFTGGTVTGTTVVARTRLNFLTNFSPTSRLTLQLETGNNGQDATFEAQNRGPNLLGTTGLLADGGGLEYAAVGPGVGVRRLYYSFMPSSNVEVAVGPQLLPRDFIDRNSYANHSTLDFNSSFFVNNPLIVQNRIDRPGGAGAAVTWRIGNSPFTLRALYVAANASQPTGNGGFLGGNQYQGSAEIEAQVNPAITVRLQYTNAGIDRTSINAGGINAEAALTRKLGVFGRYGFGTYKGFNSELLTNVDVAAQTWAVGVVLRDFGVPGSLAGLAIGQPLVENRLGNATQTNYELFYNLFLSDSVTISPAFAIVDNPNNQSGSTVWQGTVRTVFSF